MPEFGRSTAHNVEGCGMFPDVIRKIADVLELGDGVI